MRPLLLVFLLAIPASAWDAKAGKQLLKQLEKYDPVADDEPPKNDTADRRAQRLGIRLQHAAAAQMEALEAVGDEDHSTAAEFLCDLFLVLEKRRLVLDRRRDELKEEYASLVKGDPTLPLTPYVDGKAGRGEEVRAERRVLREFAYHLLALRAECLKRLGALASEDALLYLQRHALRAGKEPLLRAKVGDVLARGPTTDVSVLLTAIGKERDAGARASLVASLAHMREKAQEKIDDVLPLIDDKDEQVRVAAARLLAHLHVPEAVGPLVGRMAEEEGRTRLEIAQALSSLTGELHGPYPESWQQWWAQNQAKVLGEGLPARGSGNKDVRAMRWSGEGGSYYGLPQVSQRVLYVLDISDSMREVHEGKSRLERSQSEVVKAIQALPRAATFGVIAYNSEIRRFREEMAPASPANKQAAEAFILELRHARTTNIYDALRASFQMAGDGAKKRDARVRVDTIFLLSDGAPTKDDTTMDDVDRILQAVREWNVLGRLTIHTIGIGKDLKFSFLEQLAAENGGVFVLKEW